MRTRHLLIAIVITILANLAPPAAALTPHGRHVTGTVQKVDAGAREVELLPADTRTPVTFLWDRQTTFIAGLQTVDAAMLKKGARVDVILHVPFFGKAFVTKVALLPRDRATRAK